MQADDDTPTRKTERPGRQSARQLLPGVAAILAAAVLAALVALQVRPATWAQAATWARTATPGATTSRTGSPDADPPMSEEMPLLDTEAVRVHLLRFGPSNGYLIETAEGLTLIDAGLPTSTRKIMRSLRRLGREGDLCQILITHAHIDHFGAAAEVRGQTGAPILVHEADADALARGETNLGVMRDWEWTRSVLPWATSISTIRETPADQIVRDGERLTACGLANLDARVVHLPGHTPGSIALLMTEPVTRRTYAFVADLLSTASAPHVQSSYADSWLQLAASVERLQALAPDLSFPGHGTTAISAATLATLPMSDPILSAQEQAAAQAAQP